MKRIVVTTMILTTLLSCGIHSNQRKNRNSSIEEMLAYALEVIEDTTSTWSQIKRAVNPLSDSIIALIQYDGRNARIHHTKGQKIGYEILKSIDVRYERTLRPKNKITEKQYKKFITPLQDAVYSWFYIKPEGDFPGSIDTDVFFVANENREEPVNDNMSLGVLLPSSDNPVPFMCITPPNTSSAPVSLLFFLNLDYSNMDTTNLDIDTTNIVLLDEWTSNTDPDTGEEYFNIYGGGDVIDKMLQFSMMVYYYPPKDRDEDDEVFEPLFIPLTDFQKIWHAHASENEYVFDHSENGLLESEDITVLANDYFDGDRHEHVVPRIVDDSCGWHNKCIVVKTNADYENNYDAQLFVSAKEAFKIGDKVKFSFRARADEQQSATIHVHSNPGEFVGTCGELIIGTEWKTTSFTLEMENTDNIRTIAFNLSYVDSGNNCYFDDIKMEILTPDEFSIADFNATGKKGQYEFVDLGLSVKWATVNIGAETPYEFGDYYAWGETKQKEDYSWSSYTYCNGTSYTLKKYCIDSSSGSRGYSDSKMTLDPEDDIATVSWGGKWRIPTVKEFQELLDNCTWTWGKLNGVYGHKMTSKKNGRSIFLPEAGCHHTIYPYHQNNLGNYWSSSLDEDNPSNANYLNLGFDFNGVYQDERFFGRFVRAVCP